MRHFAIAGALCAVSLSSCGSESKSSNLSDIYWDDAETRHAAEPDELVWTIKGSGCTASALSADYILTANHCSPKTGDKYKSGAAILNGMTNDIEVVSVAEKSYGCVENQLKDRSSHRLFRPNLKTLNLVRAIWRHPCLQWDSQLTAG